MKRYHEERHIAENRAKMRRTINAAMDVFDNSFPPDKPLIVYSRPDPVGRYRKAARCSGCGRARCQVCHPEKFPKRIPTRQEKQPWKDDSEIGGE